MTRIFAGALLLALAACSSGSDTQDKAPEPAALVKLAQVGSGPVEQSVTIYGAAQNDATNQRTLTAPAEAIVAHFVVAEGDPVKKGQLVAQLSPSPTTRLDIATAKAGAQSDKLAYERAKRLRADGLVSDAEVESARAAAQSSGATVASLSGRAGSLSLRAPVAGYVQTYPVAEGQLVAAGTAVATIAQAGDLRARFGIDPAIARQLARGGSIDIQRGPGLPPITAPIVSVDPVVDPATRLASLFTRIPGSAGIGAGEPLRANVTTETSGTGPSIPYAALLNEGGQPYVYTVSDDVAHRQDVTVGATDGSMVAITGGLRPGAMVVVAGGTALEDGMKVRTK
ncbi:efflux RND transporter periplasmic adaptor subunit [Novosphingopyxis sp.]|uniref:efflux RND transporter periplasmic adaptor subunit n=1 Tax=Novosphingopyxis sp. TaxID=2709690 RepID=UPI003B5AE09C